MKFLVLVCLALPLLAEVRFLPGKKLWVLETDRTSYVVAPNDTIILSYSDLKPDDHVAKTLDAVTQWRATHPH